MIVSPESFQRGSTALFKNASLKELAAQGGLLRVKPKMPVFWPIKVSLQFHNNLAQIC